MNAGALAAMGIGMVLAGILTVTNISLVGAWPLADLPLEGDVSPLDYHCPGSLPWCRGAWWSAVVDYLPTFVILAQVLVSIAMAFPAVIMRVGSR